MKHILWTIGSPLECLAEKTSWDNPHEPKQFYTRHELLSGLSGNLLFYDNLSDARDNQRRHMIRCRHDFIIEAPAIYKVEVEELDIDIQHFQITKVLSAEMTLINSHLPGGEFTFDVPLVHEYPLASSYLSLVFDFSKPQALSRSNFKNNFDSLLLPYQMNALKVCLDKMNHEKLINLPDLFPKDLLTYEIMPMLKAIKRKKTILESLKEAFEHLSLGR